MTHRFFISAAHKSSGKTTLSIGLAAALRRRSLSVQTFKKGPDYIDPLWLGLAGGRPCRNLDFHLSSADELRAQFARHGSGSDVCLVEGNKGLYDGVDVAGSNSNAALARELGLPVVLVLDARGMTRGIAPLVLGYQAFDRDIRIAGVILNRVGGARHEAKLRAVLERYTDVPVLGALGEDPRLALVERHLGLMPANEHGAAITCIGRIADALGECVDLERLLELTRAAAPMAPLPETVVTAPGRTVRIAVARDRAFAFYYPDDLEALERAGAKLLFFDTLTDRALPAADALFIGGGFPECTMPELAANTPLLGAIRGAIECGMPTYAECGGLMYLARSLTWHGLTYRMAGVIAADVVMHEKPVGRGYVRLTETDAHPWRVAGSTCEEIRAHEFHYSSLEKLDPRTVFAYRVTRGYGANGTHDGIVHRNMLASYAHLRSIGAYNWAARFVVFARTCSEQNRLPQRPLSAEQRYAAIA
jgi:cobyrinic acid a,c-diamide synthase